MRSMNIFVNQSEILVTRHNFTLTRVIFKKIDSVNFQILLANFILYPTEAPIKYIHVYHDTNTQVFTHLQEGTGGDSLVIKQDTVEGAVDTVIDIVHDGWLVGEARRIH